jgi:hypothetical protein
MPSVTLKDKIIGAVLLVGLALGFSIFMARREGPSPPQWTLDTLEQKRNEALQLIQDGFQPSDYAIATVPAAVAAGEWSSSLNVMDCPPENQCFEVAFNMSSVNVECKWLVSYDRPTADLEGYRALNEAARNLFEEAPSRQRLVKTCGARCFGRRPTARPQATR